MSYPINYFISSLDFKFSLLNEAITREKHDSTQVIYTEIFTIIQSIKCLALNRNVQRKFLHTFTRTQSTRLTRENGEKWNEMLQTVQKIYAWKFPFPKRIKSTCALRGKNHKHQQFISFLSTCFFCFGSCAWNLKHELPLDKNNLLTFHIWKSRIKKF